MATPTDGGMEVKSRRPTAAMVAGDNTRAPETWCPLYPLNEHRSGFWLSESILPGVEAMRTRFTARPDDVVVASFPASPGTTWLKALAFAVLNRDRHPPSDPGHPLRRSSPHECVRFLEVAFAQAGRDDVFADLPSPRVLATNLPYSLLQECVTGAPDCRVVYVCSDPKDAVVSEWLYTQTKLRTRREAHDEQVMPPPQNKLDDDAFNVFCNGSSPGGPHWRHVLGYWEASRARASPHQVLFLWYENILADPVANVITLAEFLDFPFSLEEAEELLSVFPEGAAGHLRNHLTKEMETRLDGVVAAALQGSGFSFGIASGNRA